MDLREKQVERLLWILQQETVQVIPNVRAELITKQTNKQTNRQIRNETPQLVETTVKTTQKFFLSTGIGLPQTM